MDMNHSNMTMPMPEHHDMMNNNNSMMMHMTFYWGKNAQVLFSGWPGSKTGMYILSLFVVFFLAFILESLCHSQILKPKGGKSNFVSRLLTTLLHALRVGLAYLVMLALMSFNLGIFIVAIAGHAVGFLVFAKDEPVDPHFPH